MLQNYSGIVRSQKIAVHRTDAAFRNRISVPVMDCPSQTGFAADRVSLELMDKTYYPFDPDIPVAICNTG